MIMVDVVECACQVGVKNPHPPGFPAQGLEQRSYRVVAAATRPEPIASGLEPGLPLGLQRLPDPGLVAPVQDHWNSERAHFCLITGFRYVHPPDRTGPPRVAGGVHLHRHLGPGLAGQRDLPVNPRGPSARVALRDLPYADQRVRPRPQQQLLQVPRRSQVPVLDRLENPAPQPPYPLLVSSPVHLIPGITVEERPRARRSVHRSVQLVPWFWHLRCFDSKAHLPTSAPLSGPGTRPGIRPVIRQPSGRRSRYCGPRFPAAFPPPAFASWAPLPARRDSAPIAVGLPHAPRIPAHVLRTLAGFTRSARVRPGPGWTLSLPRGQRCSLAIDLSVAAACRLTSAGPYSPQNRNPTRDVDLSRHQQEFPGSRPMPVLPLTCGRHGRVGGPWAFPRASHPTDQEPATHVAVGTGRTQTCSYVLDIRRPSSPRSLIACDLVSQQDRSLPRLWWSVDCGKARQILHNTETLHRNSGQTGQDFMIAETCRSQRGKLSSIPMRPPPALLPLTRHPTRRKCLIGVSGAVVNYVTLVTYPVGSSRATGRAARVVARTKPGPATSGAASQRWYALMIVSATLLPPASLAVTRNDTPTPAATSGMVPANRPPPSVFTSANCQVLPPSTEVT